MLVFKKVGNVNLSKVWVAKKETTSEKVFTKLEASVANRTVFMPITSQLFDELSGKDISFKNKMEIESVELDIPVKVIYNELNNRPRLEKCAVGKKEDNVMILDIQLKDDEVLYAINPKNVSVAFSVQDDTYKSQKIIVVCESGVEGEFAICIQQGATKIRKIIFSFTHSGLFQKNSNEEINNQAGIKREPLKIVPSVLLKTVKEKYQNKNSKVKEAGSRADNTSKKDVERKHKKDVKEEPRQPRDIYIITHRNNEKILKEAGKKNIIMIAPSSPKEFYDSLVQKNKGNKIHLFRVEQRVAASMARATSDQLIFIGFDEDGNIVETAI